MPFIQGLIDGSLPEECFKFYIAQDAIYLQHFGRALSVIAARIPGEYMLDYMKFAQGALLVENAMHADYLTTFGLDRNSEISPACHHYISFLKSSCAFDSLGGAMAAVLPCFRIYKEVGDFIYAQARLSGNRYERWINTYAGEEFGLLVARALEITDAIAETYTEEQRKEMSLAYKRASQLEWMFWDSAWRLEQWG